MEKKWAYYNDNDPDALAAVAELMRRGFIAPGAIDNRSIKDVHPDDIKDFAQVHLFCGIAVWSYAARLARWADERKFWSMSCPCQPFSAAGKRAGVDDPRHLWPDAFRLVRSHRPERIVGEQVSGAAGYGWVDGVFADLEGEDYACEAVDVAACGFDAPHIRNRLAWTAKRMAVPDAGECDGRSEFAERRPEGRAAARRLNAGSHVGNADSDGRGGPRLSARRPNGKSSPDTSGTNGRDARSAGNARTVGHGADSHESLVRSIAPAGEFSDAQPDARIDGRGDMVDAPRERRGEGSAAATIQRGRDATASADVCERSGVDQVDTESLDSGAGLRKDGPQFDWPLASNPDGNGVTQGDAVCEGPQRLGRNGDGVGRSIETGSTSSPNGRNGTFWSDAQWIHCHDGKARRTEPSIRLLAHESRSAFFLRLCDRDSEAADIESLAKAHGTQDPKVRIPLWSVAGNSIVAVLFSEMLLAIMDVETGANGG